MEAVPLYNQLALFRVYISWIIRDHREKHAHTEHACRVHETYITVKDKQDLFTTQVLICLL